MECFMGLTCKGTCTITSCVTFLVGICILMYIPSLELFSDRILQLQRLSRKFIPVGIEQYDPSFHTILLWTSWFDRHPWMFHLGDKSLRTCEIKTCYVTYDRSKLHAAKMVLFHTRDMDRGAQDLPAFHDANQSWIFVSAEAPVNTWSSSSIISRTNDLSSFGTVFNLTATYLSASDFYAPYGVYSKRKDIRPYEGRNKTGLVLWYVSNCKTTQTKHRQEYVQELGQYVQIDVFGKCGRKDPCYNAKSRDRDDCIESTRDSYKFYLAFENCLCNEYISEKFWNALKRDTVPIVMGARMEDYTNVAPPDSFLHVDNFSTPLELAKYIQYLDENSAAYGKYTKWKEHYYITKKEQLICQICKAAHQSKQPRKYYNISQWYDYRTACRELG